MQQFRQVADVQTMETLKLPVPEIETVKPIIVRAPATAELKEFVASLANPTWRIREGRKAQVLENQRPNFLARLGGFERVERRKCLKINAPIF
jgi:hypothetical protein